MKHKAKEWRGQYFEWAHLKRDGHYTIVEKNNRGLVTVRTPTPVDITHQVRQCEWFHQACVRMPNDTVVHGELWYPGRPASYVKTALKDHSIDLQFDVFAIPYLPADYPPEILEKWAVSWGFSFAPFTREEVSLEALPKDSEGWVLKTGNMLEWYKWKPVKTLDAFVTAFVDGEGKYEGLVGALVVSVWDDEGKQYEIANVSGMDDDTREMISPDDHFRVCEVRYQYVGSGGRLRHPAFVRWRDDKFHKECTVDQDADLIAYSSSKP